MYPLIYGFFETMTFRLYCGRSPLFSVSFMTELCLRQIYRLQIRVAWTVRNTGQLWSRIDILDSSYHVLKSLQ